MINWTNPINRNHPLNKGLAAKWLVTPNGRGGSVLRDIAGRFHGTMTNMEAAADWVNRRDGGFGALSFGGTDEYVDMGDVLNFNFDASRTISFWMQTADNSGDAIIGKQTGGIGWRILKNFNSLQWQYVTTFSSNHQQVTFTQDYTDTDWHHVALVRSGAAGADIALYFDGKALTPTINTDTLSSTPANTTPLLLGAIAGPASLLIASLDDMTIWDRALSEKEVREYYALSRSEYRGILNRVKFMRSSEQAAAAGNPWYYYAQMAS